MRLIKIRTKRKYVHKTTELRDCTDFWRKRLIDNKPTHFQKHDQHGTWSPVFKVVGVEIVKSPLKYLSEGILHTKKAIKLYGRPIK
jgi:hypothetical protein